VLNSKIQWYDENNFPEIVADSPENGFSIIIIPATSTVHIKYAKEAPKYENLFYKQIIGWISGVLLEELDKKSPKVMNGQTGEMSDQKAIVLHATLPDQKIASIGIINIFKQGSGDTITFEGSGFEVKSCFINGQKFNFADYLIQNKTDLKLPLVANYQGAMVNVSFQRIDEENQIVYLYAPVFKDTEYKLAASVGNYVESFKSKLPSDLTDPNFSCNCILNYLYSELEGKKTGNIVGPITFGEIAFQLLNQTLVYLTIQNR